MTVSSLKQAVFKDEPLQGVWKKLSGRTALSRRRITTQASELQCHAYGCNYASRQGNNGGYASLFEQADQDTTLPASFIEVPQESSAEPVAIREMLS